MLGYTDVSESLGQYAWAKVVWRDAVQTVEDTQRKLCSGPLSEIQLNRFRVLIQVFLESYNVLR